MFRLTSVSNSTWNEDKSEKFDFDINFPIELSTTKKIWNTPLDTNNSPTPNQDPGGYQFTQNSPVVGWGGLSKMSNLKWMSKIGSYA